MGSHASKEGLIERIEAESTVKHTICLTLLGLMDRVSWYSNSFGGSTE